MLINFRNPHEPPGFEDYAFYTGLVVLAMAGVFFLGGAFNG